MNLEVHVLSHDDEQMLVWSLRHYASLGARVIVHDGGPKGFSTALANLFEFEARKWDTAGELNDELAMRLKNDCWRGSEARWVAVVDADELLYFPLGVEFTLARYDELGAAVPKPHGFEMFSERWFEPNEHVGTQIYDHVKEGAPEDKWYAKPILFSPRRVVESGFGIGAHESCPVLRGGRAVMVDGKWPKANPPCWLLHFKAVGPIERVAERYDATRRRLSAVNVRQGWGNVHDTGMEHALKKRALILPGLTRVIA